MLKFTGERLIPELHKTAAFYYEHLCRYLFAAQFCKGKNVLDMGSGEGYGSQLLREIGKARKVTGIDSAIEAINHAQKRYGNKSISFMQDSADELSHIQDNSIDITVSFELIEHIKNQNACIKNVKRVLHKDGILIMSTPNKYTYPSGNEFHLKELYPKQFEALLKKHFKYVVVLYQSFHMSQIIHSHVEGENILHSTYAKNEMTGFIPPAQPKNEEFIIILASDSRIPTYQTYMLATKNVDFIDLTKGIMPFEKHYYSQTANKQLEEENAYLKKSLDTITSAKFYKIWQKYCSIRDAILRKSKRT